MIKHSSSYAHEHCVFVFGAGARVELLVGLLKIQIHTRFKNIRFYALFAENSLVIVLGTVPAASSENIYFSVHVLHGHFQQLQRLKTFWGGLMFFCMVSPYRTRIYRYARTAADKRPRLTIRQTARGAAPVLTQYHISAHVRVTVLAVNESI